VPLVDLEKTYKSAGVKLLVNDGVTLAEGLHVFGTDDSTAGDPRLESLHRRPRDATLLLTHSPQFLDVLAHGPGSLLAVSGHTHGGQVRLGRAVPFLPPGSGRFVNGWYDISAGRAYVSRGTGTSIAPVRFTCRPELPIFTLRHG
jgi:predicted MPP superfamily phosphohydrolase